MCLELIWLSNGFYNTNETNTVHFMTHDKITKIPKDHTVTYACIVVDYRTQKSDPNRVRITVGGNLIKYPFDTYTPTANLVIAKLLWNSILSTKDAWYICINIKNMYLQTPMQRREYMKIKVKLFPPEFMKEYNLKEKVKNGFVYMEIRKGMYGLPQAGIFTNNLLRN